MILFKAMVKEMFRFLFSLLSLLLQVFPDSPWGNRVRGKFLGIFMKGSKGNLQICQGVHFLYPYNMEVGNDVYFGFNSWINAQGGLYVGDETIFGPFVSIATGNHTKLGRSYRFGQHEKKKVHIGRGCWLAASVCVVPGVSIADETVIASGGVVTTDTNAGALYGGVPARIISEGK